MKRVDIAPSPARHLGRARQGRTAGLAARAPCFTPELDEVRPARVGCPTIVAPIVLGVVPFQRKGKAAEAALSVVFALGEQLLCNRSAYRAIMSPAKQA